MPAPTLAIDFGTTRTKVAYYNAHRQEPQLIELGREIRPIIPSLFYIPPQGGRLVGDDAQMMIDEDAAGIVVGLKREIHRLGKIRCGAGRPNVARVELASDLFKHIRERCANEEFHEKDVTECILTVPVAFEEQKRECIRTAAELGGFKQITLVEEPVAAARAWLEQTGQKFGDNVIVCDVGGGTTDFALLRYHRGHFETVAEVPTEGISLGGNDVDEEILNHMLESAAAEEQAVEERRAGFLVRLRQAKELFARQQRPETPIRVGTTVLRVPREAVASCAREFVNRVTEGLKRFLDRCEAAGVRNRPILLVGGGSRLLGLKEAVESLSRGQVYQWNQSDYATVLGAVNRPVASVSARAVIPPAAASPVKHLRQDAGTMPARNYGAFTRHVQTLISDGRAQQAFAEVSEEMAKNPNEPLFDLFDQCTNAIPDAKAVLAACRDLHRRRSGDVWSSCCLALALSTLGRDQEAHQVLRPFLTAQNASLFPVQYAWFSLHASKGDPREEAALLNSLLDLRPDHPTLLLSKALGQGERIEPQQVAVLLDRALQRDPNHLAVMFFEIFIVIAQDPTVDSRLDWIKESLKVMERISPQHFWTRLARALHGITLQDYHGAKRELDAAAQLPEVRAVDAWMALVLRLRVIVHENLRNEADLRRDVEDWVSRDPRSADARSCRANLLAAEGKHVEAIEELTKALAVRPHSVDDLYGRGMCYLAVDHPGDAMNDFKMACRYSPGLISAKFGATCALIRKVLSEQQDPTKGPINFYLHPSIPQHKLTNVLQTYAAGQLATDSAIALLFDNTLWGGAKDGFSISEDKFMAHNLWEPNAFAVQLGDIISVGVTGTDLIVNGFKVVCSSLSSQTSGVQTFKRMLIELANLHRRLDNYRVAPAL
jgi:actin-like ATPase involved in cell morphogenesis/tetratricopeptide (TPR) repeat protein